MDSEFKADGDGKKTKVSHPAEGKGMTELEFRVEEVRLKTDYILEAIKKLPQELPEGAGELPEFITLDLAAKLKGGASTSTYKSRYFLQPCGGTNSHRVGGRKCWRKEDVLEWLTVDDDGLEEYLKPFGMKVGYKPLGK